MSVEMTEGLLNEKIGKIAQLEQRIYEKSHQNTSFMTRVVTSVRGSSEHQGSPFMMVFNLDRTERTSNGIKGSNTNAFIITIPLLYPPNTIYAPTAQRHAIRNPLGNSPTQLCNILYLPHPLNKLLPSPPCIPRRIPHQRLGRPNLNNPRPPRSRNPLHHPSLPRHRSLPAPHLFHLSRRGNRRKYHGSREHHPTSREVKSAFSSPISARRGMDFWHIFREYGGDVTI